MKTLDARGRLRTSALTDDELRAEAVSTAERTKTDLFPYAIHTGDPGAAGTANEVTGGGYTRQAPTFASATDEGGGVVEAALDANLDFSGPANEDATWFSIWRSGTFAGRGQITSGDVTFNASGQFSLTTATVLRFRDS